MIKEDKENKQQMNKKFNFCQQNSIKSNLNVSMIMCLVAHKKRKVTMVSIFLPYNENDRTNPINVLIIMIKKKEDGIPYNDSFSTEGEKNNW